MAVDVVLQTSLVCGANHAGHKQCSLQQMYACCATAVSAVLWLDLSHHMQHIL